MDAYSYCHWYALLYDANALLSLVLRLNVIAASAGVLGTTLTFLIAGSRLVMTIARDNLLPARLAQVNQRTGVPTAGVLAIGIPAATAAFLVETSLLVYMVIKTNAFAAMAHPYPLICMAWLHMHDI